MMSDTPVMCPKTLAIYAKLQPILAKLPAELTKPLQNAAATTCAAEGGATLLGAIANALPESTRGR